MMIKWLNKIFNKRNYISKEQRERLIIDSKEEINEKVEKMKNESEEKDEKIHNLLVDIMLLENDMIEV